ncbi:lipoprotein Spr/probable lipoprotein NlpC [Hymenobacter gelipurpurascens]|uniref:Lipoprotein Spr/probable lipoprotein NlpC n=1 Tax=Hymenobacter gelipurpurascens TaxID=89968 RepID=A0A212UH49_9BACT|nr:C40 family peptidase [Hymenobacter gelipurpurascens]SNC77394.1 lipoprotein Spr/probable lipoprotein NlpC [Hymenobacter gelipurpurascens]
MKNSILYCLAAASMVLSFFFERTPATHPTAQGALVAQEASFLSGLLGTEEPHTATLRTASDSTEYSKYAQRLGIEPSFDTNKDLLATVVSWLGTPYRYGSNSKSGTDCSGFVTRVFKEVYGVTLQRSSRSMFANVKHVQKDDMQTGDLVFFRRGPGQPIYHVGIYLKDGKFAHSATNGGVMVSSLNQAYYSRNFYAAGRVENN